MTTERTKNIYTHWECAEHAGTHLVPLTDLAEIGTPICETCDEEMELTENVTIQYAQVLGEDIKVGDKLEAFAGRKLREVKGWTGYTGKGYREVEYHDGTYEIIYDNARYGVQ